MRSPLPASMSDEVLGLTLACLSGEASTQEVERLGELLRDEAARRVYKDVIRDSFSLRRWADATKLHSGEMFDGCDSDMAFLRLAAADADLIVAAPVINPENDPSDTSPSLPYGFLNTALHTTVGYFSSDWPVAYLVATVIVGIGLVVGAVVHVSPPDQVANQSVLPSTFGRGAGGEGSKNLAYSRLTVGRITGMVDCQFDQSSRIADSKAEDLRPKTVLSLGDTFVLASGLLEITYDTGAKVILQGPVTYEVESKDGGYLSLGKLTAKLDKRDASFNREPTASASASEISKSPNLHTSKSDIPHPSSLIPHPLFAVRTPTATVTDLGTEFGVEVGKDGDTTSRVFRGSVTLQTLGTDGKAGSRVLRASDSARVESDRSGRTGPRIVVLDASAAPLAFVRALPKRTIKTLDLVDVVAGGDGFSHRRGRGIDTTTGQPTDKQLEWRAPPHEFLDGDYKYHRVEGLPFVDGVFIPDGRRGPVQVDSAGHTFGECPQTANRTGGYLWAGGPIPHPGVSAGVRTELGGVDYASAGHGLLFLHANKGITFDLDTIRRANPGCKVVRFQAMAGDTETSNGHAMADLWVLVDGRVRFGRWHINSDSGAFVVVVPIADRDHFLTLAATDGDDDIGVDWTMFGDPELELLPIRPRQDGQAPREEERGGGPTNNR